MCALRVTTNGTLLTYKSNLMKSTGQVNKARDKVLTQRNFNSYAEDPAAATEAFALRRNFARNNDQLNNTKAMLNKFDSAWTAVSTVKGYLEYASNKVALSGENDATAAGRDPLGKLLENTANSVVQTLNMKYADSFMFSGNNINSVPFSWSEDGKLLFQGHDVNAGMPGAPDGAPPNPSNVEAGSPWDTYYKENPDFKVLAQMSHEQLSVDVGSGLKEFATGEKKGELNTSTVFNGAISGLNILGFGKDADGDNKNSVSLMKDLAAIYQRCDKSTGEFASAEDDAAATRLFGKLQKSLDILSPVWTELDTQAQYLKDTEKRLEVNNDILNNHILGLEQADLADAITEFSWAQYCYDSALKVGNSLLGESLMDYMK